MILDKASIINRTTLINVLAIIGGRVYSKTLLAMVVLFMLYLLLFLDSNHNKKYIF